MKPTLSGHGQPIRMLAEEFFKKLTQLPKTKRPDDKERTGIQVFVREIGTDNVLIVSINKPSQTAQFLAIEKAVRSATLGHAASENSADPEKMQFAGSVTITLEDGTQFQASTSGVKAHEDVANSLIVLAYAVQWPVQSVIENVRDNGGKLPDFLSDQKHYLREFFAY